MRPSQTDLANGTEQRTANVSFVMLRKSLRTDWRRRVRQNVGVQNRFKLFGHAQWRSTSATIRCCSREWWERDWQVANFAHAERVETRG